MSHGTMQPKKTKQLNRHRIKMNSTGQKTESCAPDHVCPTNKRKKSQMHCSFQMLGMPNTPSTKPAQGHPSV